MKGNRSERIRAWLAKHKQPATALQITHALEPFGDVSAYSSALSALEKIGMVRSTKLPGCKRLYTLGREPKRTPAQGKVPNGRAERIRTLLQQHDRGFTVAEVRAAVDPQATPNMVSASLFSLAKQGQIHRAAQGVLACYGRSAAIAKRQLAAELARRAEPKPPRAAKPRKAKAEPKPKPPRPARPAPARKRATAPPATACPRTLHTPPTPSAAMRTAMDNSARPARRPRPVPVTCGLSGVSDQQQLASDRIAADIAAFQARGGRIQQLGPTQFFKHIGMEAANHVPPRTPRTGTHNLDD